MRLVHHAADLRAGRCILVPTMGALHDGHASLVRAAAAIGVPRGLPVVVTVFVNPTQFNEAADFQRYPRTLDSDAAACEAAGADALFAPPVEEVYPKGVTIPVPRTLRFTVHGPAFETADGWVAVRYAGQGEIRALEQFYRMGKARTYEAWREAMAMRAIPSFNFVYADRTGRIGFLYNAILPRRAEGVDFSGCVAGSPAAQRV